MRTRSKVMLAGLAAALLMGLAAGAATAGKFSTSNSRFRMTWRNLKIYGEMGPMNPPVECPVTLEGSFHSATIRKVVDALIGNVSRAIVNGALPPCVGGRMTLLQETLPWHVTYGSFRGTLPAITSIGVAIRGVSVREDIALLGITCLYRDRGGATEGLKADIARDEGGNLTTVTLDTVIRIARVSGADTCPPRLGFEAIGEVFLLGSSTTRIRVTLI